MSKKKNKYYVVWHGVNPGIYADWKTCEAQIKGFPQARYKSFDTKEQAEQAYRLGYAHYQSEKKEVDQSALYRNLLDAGSIIVDSICVDGAWNTATGDAEYRGVWTKNKEEIFRVGPFNDGTNNVTEYLAIVHALAFCKQHNLDLPIYSDSVNAINWVKARKHRSKLVRNNRNQKWFELLDRADNWLRNNRYENKILKWETKAWGENPADFGRK